MGFVVFILTITVIFLIIRFETLNEKIDKLRQDYYTDFLKLQHKCDKLESKTIDSTEPQQEQTQLRPEIKPEVCEAESIKQKTFEIKEEIYESSDNKPKEENKSEILNNNEYDILYNEPTKPKQEDFNLEKFFMGNLFIKIGVIALIFAFIMFIKYISQYITFTPLMKTIAGYIASIALIGLSFNLGKKENLKKYSEAILGLGFAISFITTYASCTFLEVLSIPCATTIGVILILLTFLCAHWCKTFSTVAIGLIGGYLNPFVINSDMSSNFLFGYLIMLNAISIVYVIKNSDKIALNCVNLILSTFTVTIFSAINSDSTTFIYPFILWLIYFLNDIYFVVKDRYSIGIEILNRINCISFIWFTLYIFKFEDRIAIGFITLLFAIFYFIVAIFARRKFHYRDLHISNGMLALLTATWFAPDTIMRTCFWSLEGLFCAYLYYLYNIKNSIDIKDLEKFVLTFMGISVISIFFQWDIITNSPFAIILFGAPAICSVTCAWLLADKKDIKDALNLLAATLVFTYFCTLNNNFVSEASVKTFVYITIGLLYSFNTKLLMAKKFEPLAYGVYIISVLALFISNFVVRADWTPFINFGLVVNALAIIIGCYFANKDKANMDYFKLLSLTLGFTFIVSQFSHTGLESNLNTFIYIIIGLMYSISLKFFTGKQFESIAYGFYVLGIVALFISNFVVSANWLPILNIQLAANILAIAISYYYAAKEKEYSVILEYTALFTGLLLIFSEFKTVLNYFNLESNNIICSSILIIYCAILMVLGIFKNIDYMKKFGICTTLFFIVKILLYDLAGIEAIFKLIAFMIVGVSLLLVSYFYNKKKS